MNILTRSKVLFPLFGIFFFILLLFFHFRGMTYFDEGYILNSALRMLHGEIPYRDFDIVYTPISFSYTALFLFFFGESVFAGRLAAVTIALFSLLAIYFLLQLFTKNKLLILGTLLFFISWGPTHFNFPWPTMFALCFLLYSTLFYLLGCINNSHKFFFLAGVFTFFIFLAKQNFGGGAFLIFFTLLFFLSSPNTRRNFLSYLAGFFMIAVIFITYLIATSSFLPFIENMYIYTLKRVFIDKSLETPFLYEGPFLVRAAKALFYTSPLLIALATLYFIPKHKGILMLLPVLSVMFYLLGIRPTTDYVHVVPLLAFTSVPLAVLYTYTKWKVAVGIIIASMIILGFYTAYYKGYYQWEPPLYEATTYVDYERASIYLSAQKSDELNALVDYIQSQTGQNKYIFVNAYEPMVYFLSARKNPTPYDLISVNQLPVSYQQEIINNLVHKNVTLTLMHALHKDEDSIVANYIRKNYRKTKEVGGFIMYEK